MCYLVVFLFCFHFNFNSLISHEKEKQLPQAKPLQYNAGSAGGFNGGNAGGFNAGNAGGFNGGNSMGGYNNGLYNGPYGRAY